MPASTGMSSGTRWATGAAASTGARRRTDRHVVRAGQRAAEEGSAPRSQHHHPAAREEPLSLAVAEPAAEAEGGGDRLPAGDGAAASDGSWSSTSTSPSWVRRYGASRRRAGATTGVGAALTESQSAALAATLPFPRTSNPAFRPVRMRRRQELILRRMRGERVEVPKVAEEPVPQPGDSIMWTPGMDSLLDSSAGAGGDAAASASSPPTATASPASG